MNKIQKLPPHVIAQIAAGEVIERPVYVVKELVENAIDAHASSISILIESGGIKKIVVTDNGDGMAREDALIACDHHTTSKIYDEIFGIDTFGFRGEALSSIASVADVEIKTKQHSDIEGTYISIEEGKIVEVLPIGMPPGTMITVKNIFQQLPARKKFLKSERTEFSKIVEVVSHFAMMYPKIRFLLTHNKKVVLDLFGEQTRDNRVKAILGNDLYPYMVPILNISDHFDISGYIAHPQLSSLHTHKQFIYVNNRSIKDKTISAATKEAYGSLLERDRNPIFLISIEMPSEFVDVNVHPRKEQVHFVQTEYVFEELLKTIRHTLAKHDLTHTREHSKSARSGSMHTNSATQLKNSITPWSVREPHTVLDTSDVLQIDKTFLVLQTSQGFMLVDQHAAHERILFEQFQKEFLSLKSSSKTFELSSPTVIEIPIADVEKVTESICVLTKIGFRLENFSGNSYKVIAVPEMFKDRNIALLIHELLDNTTSTKTIDSISLTMITFLACRGAIKAGESMTAREAHRLIKKLENTENNTTCPHGRPTKVSISIPELRKIFRRE